MKLRYSNNFLHTTRSLAIICVITGAAYFISIVNIPDIVQYQVIFAFLFGLILTTFVGQQSDHLKKITSSIIYLLTGFIMMLVGITGWFHSPFAFMLYLLIIVQSFYFPAVISIVQVGLLLILVIFVPDMKPISYDFLLVMSLLAVIPVSFYLREQFLYFKEAEKTIVILKKTRKKYTDKEGGFENNHIPRFSATLRETLINIKLQAYKIDTVVDLSRRKEIEREITNETTKALKLLKYFEEDSTKSLAISSSKTSVLDR